jgi:membrane associated rhomboid family serine protease
MLLIPIQHKINWSKPPIICFLLVAINVLCYLGFSVNDDDMWGMTVRKYSESHLLNLESPLYIDYKKNSGDKKFIPLNTLSDDEKTAEIIYDKGFDRFLDKYWVSQEAIGNFDAVMREWKIARSGVQDARNRISSFRFGIIPAEKLPVTFLTSMFMHGSISHLLGNMIFLLLFGFVLEVVLGMWRFLLIYLLSGIFAAWFFCLFNNGWTTLVGASGAISGLMGMYIAIYGIKPIRFFYSLVIWFGEFTAPALIVLPLWLGKELLRQFYAPSNVANLAHFGGIASGFLLAFAAVRFYKPIDEKDYSIEKTESEDDNFKRKMARVGQYKAKMDLNAAKRVIYGLQQEYPERYELIEALYDILQIDHNSQEYQDFVLQFFDEANKSAIPVKLLKRIFDEYKQLPGASPALSGPTCIRLAQRFMGENYFESADFLLRRSVALGYTDELGVDLMRRMASYCQEKNLRSGFDYYKEQVLQLGDKN